MNDSKKDRISRRQFSSQLAALMAASTCMTVGASSVLHAQTLRRVTFLLDIAPYGKHALFYPALDLGYFQEVGLDVTFEAAKGSSDNAIKVAGGSAQFGFSDAPTAILARGSGALVKLICMVHYKAMNNVVTLADNPVRHPKDMEGKTFGATAGDAPRVALPALAKINNFDASKVEIVTIEGSAKPAVLISRKADGVLGLSAFAPVYATAAEKVNQKLVQMLFADFGLDLYSNGIIASDSTIKNEPALIKAFVSALTKSMIYASEHRNEAVKMFVKRHPLSNPATVRAQLDVAIDHLLVDEVKQNGIGPMGQSKMQFTLDIVREFYGLKGKVELDDVYTNMFTQSNQRPKVG